MNEWKEGRTHTGDAFLDFAYDFLQNTLPKFGFPPLKPPDYERRTKKLYTESFGQVVVLFRARHMEDFIERSNFIHGMESTDDILYYVACCRERIFKGKIPLMELIAYHALLLDISFICLDIDDPDLLYNIVDDTTTVFRKHIQPYFTIVGGWYALYQVAEQYIWYMSFQPQGNVTSKENVDLHRVE